MFQFYCIDCPMNAGIFNEIHVPVEKDSNDNQRGINAKVKKIQELNPDVT